MNPIVTPFNINNEKYFIYDNFEMPDKLNANLFFIPLDGKEVNYSKVHLIFDNYLDKVIGIVDLHTKIFQNFYYNIIISPFKH